MFLLLLDSVAGGNVGWPICANLNELHSNIVLVSFDKNPYEGTYQVSL